MKNNEISRINIEKKKKTVVKDKKWQRRCWMNFIARPAILITEREKVNNDLLFTREDFIFLILRLKKRYEVVAFIDLYTILRENWGFKQ